jgi:small-conductance mechanosensitive channel
VRTHRLGIGGIALALAAQKTLENFIGGVSVLGDRVIRIGDVCRFGDTVGPSRTSGSARPGSARSTAPSSRSRTRSSRRSRSRT